MLPDRLVRVVQLFAKLPGVGEKTAQRYAIALLSADEGVARDLGRAAPGVMGPNPKGVGGMGSRRRGTGRRKVGRKKRRMRAKIRHRK